MSCSFSKKTILVFMSHVWSCPPAPNSRKSLTRRPPRHPPVNLPMPYHQATPETAPFLQKQSRLLVTLLSNEAPFSQNYFLPYIYVSAFPHLSSFTLCVDSNVEDNLTEYDMAAFEPKGIMAVTQRTKWCIPQVSWKPETQQSQQYICQQYIENKSVPFLLPG